MKPKGILMNGRAAITRLLGAAATLGALALAALPAEPSPAARNTTGSATPTSSSSTRPAVRFRDVTDALVYGCRPSAPEVPFLRLEGAGSGRDNDWSGVRAAVAREDGVGADGWGSNEAGNAP